MKPAKFLTLILAVVTLAFSDAASGQNFLVDWYEDVWPA